MSKPWDKMIDRERDALIAEKVMGAEREEVNYTIGHSSYTSVFWHIGGWRFDEASLPHYSTEIAAAWRVVERMTDHSRDDWCTFDMDRRTDWDDPTWGYQVRFGRQYDATHQRDRMAWARTAPEAICLAALKAVGYEGSNDG